MMISIIFYLFASIIVYCDSQSDSLHNSQLAFHLSEMAGHQMNFHPTNNQPILFAKTQSGQSMQNVQRSNRLMTPSSLSRSSNSNDRLNDHRQFSVNSQQQSNFKPMNRPFQQRSTTQSPKRSMKKHSNNHHRNSGHHHSQSKINWGRCKMLQPSLEEKTKKTQVISKCLEITPVPENITRETIELHRELVAACALREEGWFTSSLTSDETNTTKISANDMNVNTKFLDINTTVPANVSNITNNSTNVTSTIEIKQDVKKPSNSSSDTIKISDIEKKIDNVTTSETSIQPTHLDTNATKIELKKSITNEDEKNSSLSQSHDLENGKSDQNDDMIERHHSLLESDDYVEEDFSGYSAIFTGQLTYNYAKAEHEIRAKKFDADVEEKVIRFHENCREEAQEKYSNPIQIIGQIQLYQACMDFYISQVCGIEVTSY